MIRRKINGKLLKGCYVDKSKIHRRGVFANQLIRRRAKIGSLSGEIIAIKYIPKIATKKASIAMVEITNSLALDSSQFKNELCYVNHSCKPNCFMRIIGITVEVYALRTISKGDELTLDYKDTHHEGNLECKCGNINCKKFI